MRYKTRRLGAGSGVAGSVAEFRESGGRLRSRFGGPEAKTGRWKTFDLSATLVNSWPPDCNVCLSLSRVSIWRFAAWSATSQLPIGIFLGINFPISSPIFEGPSAHNPDLKQAISPTPALPEFGAPATTRLSVPTLPSRAHPRDYGRRTTPSNFTTLRYLNIP